MKILKTIILITGLFINMNSLQAKQENEFPSNLIQRLVAHRGAHNNVPNNDLRHLPENSLLSLREAFDIGLRYVECDIHMTADEHVIVFHDRTLRQLARYNPALATTLTLETFEKILDVPVQQLSYQDVISQVDIGSYSDGFDPAVCQGTKIPLLEDFLVELQGHPERTLIVELKTGNSTMVPKLKALIDSHCQEASLSINQFIFISFDYTLIKTAKAAFPFNKHFLITIQTPSLMEAYPDPENPGEYLGVYHRIKEENDLTKIIELAKNASLDGLCIEYNAKQIDLGFIQQIKHAELVGMVWIYPKDDHINMIRHLLNAEVNLISTNQPQYILNALDSSK